MAIEGEGLVKIHSRWKLTKEEIKELIDGYDILNPRNKKAAARCRATQVEADGRD